MSREIIQQALDALKLVYEQADFSNGVTDPTGTIDEGRVVIGGIVSESIQTLEAALAQPEQTGIPEFPEPFTKADIEYAPHESWDDERERDWLDLQVCQRNKIRLHKYARQLRELLAKALAQPEQEPVTNSDLYSTAGRLALELECLLLDTKDISIASKWWDSAHEALDQWRKFHFRFCNTLDSATHSADSAETFGKREWVGLTEDEIKKIMQRWRGGYIDIKDVEQLLKDKNDTI